MMICDKKRIEHYSTRKVYGNPIDFNSCLIVFVDFTSQLASKTGLDCRQTDQQKKDHQ